MTGGATCRAALVVAANLVVLAPRPLNRGGPLAHPNGMMAKRILVPLASGEESAAVSVVGAVAREHGSTVRLLRVMPVPERVDGPHGRTIAYADQEMERLTHEGLDELRIAESQLHGVPVETIVRFGEPVEEILLEADAFGAELIAVSSDTRSRLKAAVAPGIGERVLRRADVPVLLLRA